MTASRGRLGLDPEGIATLLRAAPLYLGPGVLGLRFCLDTGELERPPPDPAPACVGRCSVPDYCREKGECLGMRNAVIGRIVAGRGDAR